MITKDNLLKYREEVLGLAKLNDVVLPKYAKRIGNLRSVLKEMDNAPITKKVTNLNLTLIKTMNNYITNLNIIGDTIEAVEAEKSKKKEGFGKMTRRSRRYSKRRKRKRRRRSRKLRSKRRRRRSMKTNKSSNRRKNK